MISKVEQAHTRTRYLIKKFVGATYHIKFLCSNIRIEANEAIYNIKSEKHDFESRTSKLVHQIRNTHTRARYLIRKFIGASYHIEFLCSNMRIKANVSIYDINSKKCDF